MYSVLTIAFLTSIALVGIKRGETLDGILAPPSRPEISKAVRMTQDMTWKNFSQAAVNNAEPIFDRIKDYLELPASLLEVGSFSGQHAVYMTERLADLHWQTSDREENVVAVLENLKQHGSDKTPPPLLIDLDNRTTWAKQRYDAVFSANVIHIAPARLTPNLFQLAEMVEAKQVILYGPYKYDGHFTTESNARFDLWLKERNPESGIRDIEYVVSSASESGFMLHDDIGMPANNQLLRFTTSSRS